MAWLVSDTREAHTVVQFKGRLTEKLVDLCRESASAAAGPSSNWLQVLALFSEPDSQAHRSYCGTRCCLRSYLFCACRNSARPLGLPTWRQCALCSRVGPRFNRLHASVRSVFHPRCFAMVRGRQQSHFLQVACSQPLVRIHAPRSLPDDEIRVGRTMLPRMYSYVQR